MLLFTCLSFKAEELLVEGFPEKIVKLNELLETPGFCNRKLSDVHQELNVPIPDPIIINHSEDGPATKKLKVDNNSDETSGTKVMVLPNGPVPCNKKLCDLIHIVKPYIRELLEDSNLVSTHLNVRDTQFSEQVQKICVSLIFNASVIFFSAKNVDLFFDPKNRGWKQLWSVYSRRYVVRNPIS